MMTTKLKLNDEIKSFFETDDKQIWDLIAQNSIDDLITILPREDDTTLDLIIKELILSGKSEILNLYNFASTKEEDIILLRNLIRLIFALDINDNYEEVRLAIADKLFDIIPDMVEIIQKETGGRIDESTLNRGAMLRTSLMNLIYYYHQKDDIEALHFVIIMRSKITLAIMGNYKNVLGHDMIESAKIKEKIGDTGAALGFYNLVKDRLKGELHWFVESPEMGANEEDTVMLQSLKEAFASIDRLNKTSEFEKACTIIDEILSREYEEFNFEDEEEDEE
ncbi:hypothetical protein JGH11_01890 [Dysgonomonas sp. Marseille-P4677]|uniref:hypothetical protein n=1 Tax=Dysgonomonas sp. Marseille-P4677 TaxID=2364790 RepID=UPI001912C21F|nr:hypothetical protein [Dysgonomonas sp. Marseille-P4677]MBK5719615.1 hypothetical protein [Dysgonomonas sp. Marseille-P4677]